MLVYKLFRKRKRTGTLGPLFINRKQVVPIGVWLKAECHPTTGFKVREGWHATLEPTAPHLSTKGRVWCLCEANGVMYHHRPSSQGGMWVTADKLKVLEELDI